MEMSSESNSETLPYTQSCTTERMLTASLGRWIPTTPYANAATRSAISLHPVASVAAGSVHRPSLAARRCRAPESADPLRHLPLAADGGEPDHDNTGASRPDRSLRDRRCARSASARHRRDQLPLRSQRHRAGRLRRLDLPRVPATRWHGGLATVAARLGLLAITRHPAVPVLEPVMNFWRG